MKYCGHYFRIQGILILMVLTVKTACLQLFVLCVG